MADIEANKVDNECEEVEGADDSSTNAELNKALMKNPQILAAVQDHLMVQSPADYIKSLPKSVRRRLKALKRLQADANKVESQFYEEVHEIERKYMAQYEPFFQRRKDIISAQAEPTDAECDWPSDEETELSDDLKAKAKLEEITEGKENDTSATKLDENTKGIPDFWLTIFKNVEMIAEMIQPHDEPILKHLQDVELKLNEKSGFTLNFMFEPNEYFTNPVLTKEYFIRFTVEDDNPLGYEGPDIVRCTGCTIDWKKGKNVTVKVVKKVQKHKGRGTKRTVMKTVQNDSFFNFFAPPHVEEDEEPDEETEALLTADFEIGHFLRESIIPRAVLYFTGEALEDDDDDDEYGHDDDDDNEDDDADDDDDDHPALPAAKGKQQEECKQQ